MKISQDLERLFRIACLSDATVLVTGSTGTGKTTLAKRIHENSSRKNSPFVCINLASLHEGVLESELFGHEKGAFTGADQKRCGKLELAQGGTVFLDEVSELSPRLQARLLEFLQCHSFCPVGSNREVHLNVRVIAATHRDLTQAVRKGEFREDLFHRLRVIAVPLKPLRERPDELDALVHSCLSAAASQANRSILRISPAVAEKFERYSWPGNLRELKNVIDFAVLASEGPIIDVGDLPPWLDFESSQQTADGLPLAVSVGSAGVLEIPLSLHYLDTMRKFEKRYLQWALDRFRGRVTRTAKEIGMNKTTLIRRIKAYAISLD